MHHFLAYVMNAAFELHDVLPAMLVHLSVHRFQGKQKDAINVKFCHEDLHPVNAAATNERPRYRSENALLGRSYPTPARHLYLS